MHSFLRALARAGLALATLILPGSTGLRAQDPPLRIPLDPWRSTISLRATIGGREGHFVLDTAGGISILTPAFAQKVGLAPWGRLSGHQMMGDRLDMPQVTEVPVRLGGLDLGRHSFGVFDILSLYPKDAAPIDGSLALDLFDGRALTLDFPARTLTLETPGSLGTRAARATELPVKLSREIQGRALAASVGVPSAKGLVWMELDSGNGGTILISKPYAALFGLDPTKEGPQAVSFDLAPGVKVSGRSFTPDMLLDGNLGMPFLKDVAMTLDLGRGRLWIAPGKSPTGGPHPAP
ncbi:MAG TPA: aspartyl protease family protein [Holophagaceae bacterium]|nr:aspartyl protease family protein [Holophagaceae bacterium]